MKAGKLERLPGWPTIHSSCFFPQNLGPRAIVKPEAELDGWLVTVQFGGQGWGKEASGGFRPRLLAVFSPSGSSTRLCG